MAKVLDRVDKNGTEYYSEICTCGKCGGSGIISCYIPINGGECFDCGGSGLVRHAWKEYTPEYEAKLEARRAKKEAARKAKAITESEEKNLEFFTMNGFNEEGKTYAVLGNTYNIKEELKAMGAKWQSHISVWCLPQDTDKYPTVELDVEDIYFKDYTDSYKWNNYKRADEETYSAKIEEAKRALVKVTNPTEFYGEVGEKVTKTVVFSGSHSYETHFTYNGETHYIYTFKDNENHVFVWKTSKWLELVEGSKVVLTGTIKEHNEYKGINQTVLTRCKIA